MLDLARRVLRAYEAAVQAAHLVTFRGRVLVLKLGLIVDMEGQHVSHVHSGHGASHKGSPDIRVGVPAHGEGSQLLP
jgi:hypothetical protein